jgi:hypothetical protein
MASLAFGRCHEWGFGKSSSQLSVMPCRQAEKYLPGTEQPFGTIVDVHAPGEAPQPLTLNSLGVEPRLL